MRTKQSDGSYDRTLSEIGSDCYAAAPPRREGTVYIDVSHAQTASLVRVKGHKVGDLSVICSSFFPVGYEGACPEKRLNCSLAGGPRMLPRMDVK